MRQTLRFVSTAVLMAITATVMIGLAITWRAGPVATPLVALDERTVTRFYEAVNAGIASGDATALATVTTDDFVERDRLLGASPDRSGLSR